MSIHEKLAAIQQAIKAPKNQNNTFGGFKYRSIESVNEAVKPHLDGCHLVFTDELIEMAGRLFIQSACTLTDGKESVSNTAYAEIGQHKGMSAPQCTGTASSYCRKYAAAGLLLIDSSEDDPDSIEPEKPWFNEADLDAARPAMLKALDGGRTTGQIISNIRSRYRINKQMCETIESMGS